MNRIMPPLNKIPTLPREVLRLSVLALVISFCAAIPSFAQQEQIDSLAAKTASAIAKSLKTSPGSRLVIVFFSEPSNGSTQLSAKVADEFTTALAANRISLMNNAMFQATAQKDKVASSALTNPATASCIASDAGAEIMVDGMLRPVGNRIELSVSVIRAQNAKEIFKTRTDFDRSPEIDKLESEALPAPDAGGAKKVSVSSAPQAGKNGYTAPGCLYCPNPQYTNRAFHMHEQGKIVLDTTIGVDGRAHSVTILQGLSCDLNQQALDIIENVYRFKPANGPDGKPVAVHMLFEIEFRLY